MTKGSNSQNPYSFHFEDYGYVFITDNEVRYIAYFVDYTPFYPPEWQGFPIYSFSVEVLGTPKSLPQDPRIAITVVEILSEFFESSENVAVAIYDSLDERAHARYRKFNGWYEYYRDERIEKHDLSKEGGDFEILTSIMIHTDNPHKESIIKLFKDIVENDLLPPDYIE